MKWNRQQFHKLIRAAVFVGMIFAAAINSPAQTVTILDARGAGTIASGNNTAGVITNRYADSGTVAHGFVRSATGTFITFDIHHRIRH